MEQELEVKRCKLLYTEWINNKVLLYSIENYIQQPMINHNGIYSIYSLYIFIYIYIKIILLYSRNQHIVNQLYINKKNLEKKKQRTNGSSPAHCPSSFPLTPHPPLSSPILLGWTSPASLSQAPAVLGQRIQVLKVEGQRVQMEMCSQTLNFFL